MSWKRLVRTRSFVAAGAVLLVVIVVWSVALAQATRSRSLDDRVNDVASQLQCIPCQGESVADSPSTWAANVRAVIRAKLKHGESEQQVIQDMVNSYGERAREVPPLSGFTLIIWLGPVVMLLAGLFVVGGVARQWRAAAALANDAPDPELEGVSAAELERYRVLLEEDLTPPAPLSHEERGEPTALTPQPSSPRGKGESASSPRDAARRGGAGGEEPRLEVR
jgi:cytochrome c-type biogenesis protein CcmH